MTSSGKSKRASEVQVVRPIKDATAAGNPAKRDIKCAGMCGKWTPANERMGRCPSCWNIFVTRTEAEDKEYIATLKRYHEETGDGRALVRIERAEADLRSLRSQESSPVLAPIPYDEDFQAHFTNWRTGKPKPEPERNDSASESTKEDEDDPLHF